MGQGSDGGGRVSEFVPRFFAWLVLVAGAWVVLSVLGALLDRSARNDDLTAYYHRWMNDAADDETNNGDDGS